MRRREEQALRLAVATGNLERARQAAERLFGLRLDTDTQVRLAGQMHQLGQHELAEAVLGRARRRAGNKASALVGLMLQYQRQDKIDAAVQAALQILQSTTAMHMTNPNVYNPDSADAARSSAIQVLARSGRIKAIIERAEEQLEAHAQRDPAPPGAGRLLQGRRPARQGPRRAGQGRRPPARRRRASASRSAASSCRKVRPRRPSSTSRPR